MQFASVIAAPAELKLFHLEALLLFGYCSVRNSQIPRRLPVICTLLAVASALELHRSCERHHQQIAGRSKKQGRWQRRQRAANGVAPSESVEQRGSGQIEIPRKHHRKHDLVVEERDRP